MELFGTQKTFKGFRPGQIDFLTFLFADGYGSIAALRMKSREHSAALGLIQVGGASNIQHAY